MSPHSGNTRQSTTERLAPTINYWTTAVLVALAGLSVHLFHWFGRKPEKLARLLAGQWLRPSDVRSFLRNGIGFIIGAIAIWWVLSYLVARKRRRSLGQTLARGKTAFAICLAFAPLSLVHGWPATAELVSFPIYAAIATAFVVALARAHELDIATVFDPARPWRKAGRWAAIVAALLFADLTAQSLYRFYTSATHIDDLGLYDQMCWGLVNGYGFLSTIYNLPADNFLAEHIMPTVAVFAQLYRIWADPRLLLLLQSVALAAGAWLVFLIARHRTSSYFFPALLTLSYAVNPLLERGWINDFHIDAIEVPLYLAAYALLLRPGRLRLVAYWLCVALLLGCKEDVGLSMAAFGVVVAVAHRRRALGLTTAAIGFVWSLIAITQLLPHFASVGGLEVVRTRQLDNYAHLGATPVEIALAPLLHPVRFLKAVTLPDRVVSLLRVLGPVGFLPLAAPLWLLLLAPPYFTTILSGWEGQYNLHTHYGLVFIAPAYLAAIEGWRRLEARFERRPHLLRSIAVAFVCLALLSANEYRKFRLSRPLKWRRAYRKGINRDDVLKVAERIPDDAPLCVDQALGPMFTQRRFVYKFPNRRENTRFVLVMLRPNPIGPGQNELFRKIISQWILNEGFGIRKIRDDVLLLEKGYTGGNQKALFEKVMSKIRP